MLKPYVDILCAVLASKGIGAPVKKLTDLLVHKCPPHTVWHWAFRSWRYLCVNKTARREGSSSPATHHLSLTPACFPKITNWNYAGALALAKESIARGMKVADCYQCALPASPCLGCHHSSCCLLVLCDSIGSGVLTCVNVCVWPWPWPFLHVQRCGMTWSAASTFWSCGWGHQVSAHIFHLQGRTQGDSCWGPSPASSWGPSAARRVNWRCSSWEECQEKRR